MKRVVAALLLSPLAAPVASGPAWAQDDPPARLTGRTATLPPLSNRALPAAPTIHRLSIGPLSRSSALPLSEDDIAAGSADIADDSTEALHRRARLGEPDANYRLGLKYLAGEGVTRDMVEAFARIRIAAEAAHPRALPLFYTLGAMLSADEHGRAFDRSQQLRTANEASR